MRSVLKNRIHHILLALFIQSNGVILMRIVYNQSAAQVNDELLVIKDCGFKYFFIFLTWKFLGHQEARNIISNEHDCNRMTNVYALTCFTPQSTHELCIESKILILNRSFS